MNAEKRAYDILLEETDPAFVNFEFDSYWFTEGRSKMRWRWTRAACPRIKSCGTSTTGHPQFTGSAIRRSHPEDRGRRWGWAPATWTSDSLMAQALANGGGCRYSGKPPQLGGQFPHQELPAQCKIPCAKIRPPSLHYFLLHYPHKDNAPHRLLLPVRGVVFCGESFCVTGCGCPAARSGFCHPGGQVLRSDCRAR